MQFEKSLYSILLSSIKRHFSSIGLYLLASLIPMALNILINPFVAISMSPIDFSIVGFYSSFSSLVAPLVSFYAFGYYAKRFYEVEDDNARRLLKATIFKGLIFFSFFLSLFSLFGVFIYMNWFNRESTIPFYPIALFSVLTIPLSGIYTLELVDLKMGKNANSFFKYSIVFGFLTTSLTFLLVIVFKFGALGKQLSSFLASGCLFIFILKKQKVLLRQNFDWVEFKRMLNFVWPLIIGAMLHFFTKGYDIIFLERLNNSTELGYYVVATQIVGYIGIFQTSINNTFQPDVYKAIIEKNFKSAFKYIILTLFLLFLIILIFYFLCPFLIKILTAGKYVESTVYAKVLSISQLTMAIYFVTTEIFIIYGLTKLSLISKFIGIILTILMFYYFITKWHYLGAAWGVVVAFLVLSFINIFILGLRRLPLVKYFNDLKS